MKNIQENFELYKIQWLENTKFSSTLREIEADENCQKIIDLGVDILPLIFKEIKEDNGRRWIIVLHRMAYVNLMKPGHTGDLKSIVQDWIEWGKQNKHII